MKEKKQPMRHAVRKEDERPRKFNLPEKEKIEKTPHKP
jgi:hypothetical protein